MKKIFLFGATGSVGQTTLSVIKSMNTDQLVGISFNSKINIAIEIINNWKTVQFVCCPTEFHGLLKNRFPKIKIVSDFNQAFKFKNSFNFVVNAVTGFIGLDIFLQCMKNKKHLAFANKEPMVAAGKHIVEGFKKKKINLLPMDSEHSAIMSLLEGEKIEEVKEIIITASGGPFFDYSLNQLEDITVAETINHPVWSMGEKISVDSATMFNKALEIIEAYWLFGIKRISILVNKASVVHSLVKFNDNTIKAHISKPDMVLPIQFALTYPAHKASLIEDFDLSQNPIFFQKPDIMNRFKAIKLAYMCLEHEGTLPAVLNAANEVVNSLFLQEKIKFIDIVYIVENIMESHKIVPNPSIEEIIKADAWARKTALSFISKDKDK